MPQHPPAVYAVTAKGLALGRRLADHLGATLFAPARLAGAHGATPFDSLAGLVAATFDARPAHVFVCACGIAVRAIAPHLRDKAHDPAVVCLDDAGRFAVSLLSGHLGGANDLARELAALTGAVPVVTTATDAAGAPAIEMLARDNGLTLGNAPAVRRVNAALAAGKRVAVFDPLGLFSVADAQAAAFFEWVAAPVAPDADTPLVVVDWRLGPEAPDRLYLRPKVLVAGVGCRRGAPAADILGLLERVCRERGLSRDSIGVVASIAAKRDEPGLLEAAAQLGAALAFFSPEQLAAVPAPHPSDTVKRHMGVGSVCEAAAMLASGGGKLLAPKTVTKCSTAALCLAV
ncbi:cobalt-precorrin 5A hydrolase [Solidesulfovibrio alcoholivorans]|uniref:cobalt-precorrin 5A hydrolase n=1 Tax=Solidesulfovibrio alcoholivorans TaxID=81406 RepID=UPI00049600AE|nr:cobalamin biosynthesis protein [Solidesulfovibrio alcoholivorans]